MLRIDFSKLCFLVLDEYRAMRRLRRALILKFGRPDAPKATGFADRLTIPHPFANTVRRISANAAIIHLSLLTEKARAVA